ncbi:MAG: 5-formyltetrahydrofolate cyclo-ligase [Pirellulales bacterium]
MNDDLKRQKDTLRRQAHSNRRAQPDKDELSRQIWRKLLVLPEFLAAKTVMLYLDYGPEVRTRPFLPAILGGPRRVVIPYCVDQRLGLFLLESMDELAQGTAVGLSQLWEPRPDLRGEARKRVEVNELDLIVVPGVAFDRGGARLGHGQGYYDKLLAEVAPAVPRVGLAYECQVFLRIPVEPHDVPLGKIITELAIYERQQP